MKIFLKLWLGFLSIDILFIIIPRYVCACDIYYYPIM